MGLLETKSARFEIREHGLDAPARGVSQGGEISRLGRHGDDPGLGMPRIADDAEVGRDPLAGKDDILEIVAAGQGECASRDPCCPQAGGLSGISCGVGHDWSKGAHPCRVAKSLISLTPSLTSCWPAPTREPPWSPMGLSMI